MSNETKETSSQVEYSQELADLIIDKIAGGKSMAEVCSEPGMPSRAKVWRWLRRFPEFNARYDALTAFRSDIADLICAEIANGSSLRSLENQEGMPSRRTIFRWRRQHPEFREQYDAAVKERVAVFAEDIVEISDDGTNDWVENNDPDNPGYRFNGEHVQRSRLRVDTRKWLLAKMHPKQYGDRVAAELTGKDGGPIETADMTEPELARRIAFTLARGVPHAKTEH